MPAPVVPSNSGTSVHDLLKSFEELVGPDAVVAARRRLDAADREVLASATALSWVPIVVLGRFVDAIGEEAKTDPDMLLDRAVRLSTTRTLKTLWRLLLTLTTDEALVARTPLLYSKSRNVGRLTARLLGKGRAELRLVDYPEVSRRQMRTLAVSITTVVELAGRRMVRTTFEPTADGAVYQLSWT